MPPWLCHHHTPRRTTHYVRRRPDVTHAIPPEMLCSFDIGSNLGMYSLAAAAACFEALAFEPVPANAQRLLLSAQANRFHRIRIFTIAASDAFGTARMGFSGDNQGAVEHVPAAEDGSSAHVMNIAMAPLDAVIPSDVTRGGRPVYLKLDVEGSECRALRGLRGFLSNSSTRIVGAIIETGQPATHACCSELVGPAGAFALLHSRHGLCARDAANDDALVPLDESLCARPLSARDSAQRWPWELVWGAC